MATPSLIPGPEPERPKVPRVKMRWKWSLLALAIFLAYGMYECGTALYHGRALSNAAVSHFHEQMNGSQYEAILEEADPAFVQEGKKEEVLKFLETVHRKLGNTTAEDLVNIHVSVETTGTYVVTTYATKYARASATETFTWKKKGDTLRLLGYNINSNTLVVD